MPPCIVCMKQNPKKGKKGRKRKRWMGCLLFRLKMRTEDEPSEKQADAENGTPVMLPTT